MDFNFKITAMYLEKYSKEQQKEHVFFFSFYWKEHVCFYSKNDVMCR